MGDAWHYNTIHNSSYKVIEQVGAAEVRQFRLFWCIADEFE